MQHNLNTTMKKFLNIFLGTLVLLSSALLNAQAPPPPGGGGGGTTPEAASAPIDMYIYILAIIGMIFITYFAKKYYKKLI